MTHFLPKIFISLPILDSIIRYYIIKVKQGSNIHVIICLVYKYIFLIQSTVTYNSALQLEERNGKVPTEKIQDFKSCGNRWEKPLHWAISTASFRLY